MGNCDRICGRNCDDGRCIWGVIMGVDDTRFVGKTTFVGLVVSSRLLLLWDLLNISLRETGNNSSSSFLSSLLAKSLHSCICHLPPHILIHSPFFLSSFFFPTLFFSIPFLDTVIKLFLDIEWHTFFLYPLPILIFLHFLYFISNSIIQSSCVNSTYPTFFMRTMLKIYYLIKQLSFLIMKLHLKW